MYAYVNELPLIDSHTHRCLYHQEPDFGQLAGGTIGGPSQERHARQRLLFDMFLEEMRKRFGMEEGSSKEEIEAERMRRVQADPDAYYRDCLEGSNVLAYCLETGSPLRLPRLTPEETAFFDGIMGEKAHHVIRVERYVDDLLPLELPFEQFEKRLYDEISLTVETEHGVGIKSQLAYYAGLNYYYPSRAEAEAAYEELLKEPRKASAEAVLYRYTIMIGADIAYAYGIPLQIHTGPGNGLTLDHKSFDPVNLSTFFRDKRILNRVRIVLLHAGQPYEVNTGFLAAQYSNVYTDFSNTLLGSSINARERLLQLFEYAPMSKIMYGSDSVFFPEMYWYCPMRFRQVLASALDQLIREGYIGRSRAEEIARMICYENALECYDKLDPVHR